MLEIILTKPKFQSIQKLMAPMFGPKLDAFTNLQQLEEENQQKYLALMKSLMKLPDYRPQLQYNQTLMQLLASSSMQARADTVKLFQVHLQMKPFEEALNEEMSAQPSLVLNLIHQFLMSKCEKSFESYMFQELLVEFQMLCMHGTNLKQQLVACNPQKREIVIQVLSQISVSVASEHAVRRVVELMQLLRGEKVDQHLLNLMEQVAAKVPSVQLIHFIFSFKMSNQTFIFLQQVQKRMEIPAIKESILIPLHIFLSSLPKQIQDNDALNECCGLLINIFQLHLVQMGAEETENHAETIQIFIQNLLQLIRRGYGRNERFGPMVKKLLKVCKYS